MRDRWYRKAKKNPYDPQIGAAAQAQASLAKETTDWNKQYFEDFVRPSMDALVKDSAINTERQGRLFNLSYDQAKQQAERYKTVGLPAEDRYYKMVDEYSAPEEEQRQAQRAVGDIEAARKVSQAGMMRRLGGLGIDPTSPAALSAASDEAVANSAMRAGAATRARDAAKVLGMSLKSDAANFARGGASGVLQSIGAAGGASSAAAGGAAQAAGVAPGGASGVNTGFNSARAGYGSNLDAYTGLGTQSIQSYTSPLQQIGTLAGQLGGAAISKYSDRALKKHAQRVAILAHDIGVWVFRYLWEPDTAPLRIGYMADEVEPVFPDAVTINENGFKMVDYTKVPV